MKHCGKGHELGSTEGAIPLLGSGYGLARPRAPKKGFQLSAELLLRDPPGLPALPHLPAHYLFHAHARPFRLPLSGSA